MRTLFEAYYEKGLGGSSFYFLFFYEEFGRSLWRVWRAMKGKLWGLRYVDLYLERSTKTNRW